MYDHRDNHWDTKSLFTEKNVTMYDHRVNHWDTKVYLQKRM